jgi:hypothetical protein
MGHPLLFGCLTQQSLGASNKIKTNNLSHIFIYDFIITFIKSYNCSHDYNIIISSSQLQIASEKYLYYNE